MCLPIFLSRSRSREQPHEAHRRRHLFAGAFAHQLGHRLFVVGEPRHFHRHRLRAPRRHRPAERLAPLAEIHHLRAVVRRHVERRLGHALVGDRNAEPRAELAQLLLVELLLVVRDVAAFAAFAQAVAFDRLGEDHGRLALALDGRLVGRVDLLRIVPAAAHLLQLLVGVVLHHLQQLGILAEEILADVVAAGDDVLLILAVDDFHHPLLQQAGFVLLQAADPSRRPR